MAMRREMLLRTTRDRQTTAPQTQQCCCYEHHKRLSRHDRGVAAAILGERVTIKVSLTDDDRSIPGSQALLVRNRTV